MQFNSFTSQSNLPSEIVRDLTSLAGSSFDLGILFITPRPREEIALIVGEVRRHFSLGTILACTSAGVIGQDKEVENTAGASLLVAKLPGVKIQPFYVDQQQLISLTTPQAWFKFFDVYPTDNPIFVALPDPFLFDINVFVQQLNTCYPKAPVVGGLASGAGVPQANVLVVNDQLYDQGTIGMVLSGNLRVETVVSQGCRPVGETFIITKAERNIIQELAGKPFIEIVKTVYESVPLRDQELIQQALFVGIAMDEYKHSYHRGDFLIRGVIAIEPESGAGVVGDFIKKGQTIQLHVRDAQAATEDLYELLNAHVARQRGPLAKGAMVFSCNGRGEGLFNIPNHDINIIQQKIGPLPAAGFFCAGEIGPVGGKNFLHGFTDSIALFYPKENSK